MDKYTREETTDDLTGAIKLVRYLNKDDDNYSVTWSQYLTNSIVNVINGKDIYIKSIKVDDKYRLCIRYL